MSQTEDHLREEMQEKEYEIPYHYQDLYAPGQEIERGSLFNLALEKLALPDKAKVLDAGCGDGRFCYRAKDVYDISGIDISERAIGWARMFNPELKFHVCHMHELDEDNFDGMVCLEVIEHVPDDALPLMIAEMAKRLRPGGRAFFSVPSVNQPLHPKHYRHYTEALLRQSLEPHYKVLEVIGHARTRSLVRPINSALNLFSCLFYSDTFCRRFAGIVNRTISLKKRFWYRYLHTDKPELCNRLVAVCEKE